MTDRDAFALALHQHLSACREKDPIPPRESLSAIEEAQCRVLGGHLIWWLSDWGPRLLEERAFFSKMKRWDSEPTICFHSTTPGLVAAQEILADGPGRVVYGSPEDFQSLPDRDEEFIFHVELHSLLVPVAVAKLDPEVRRRYPLARRSKYLLHRTESVLGPLFVRGAHHLWKWDGEELMLLEEGFEMWMS